jgi:2-hydroxychromene-2-carboxylate isomerase
VHASADTQAHYTTHRLTIMPKTAPHIDYYLAPHSPWTYLGHTRLAALVKETGATVRVLPMDLGAIFPLSGGLPLPQRAPQRQAYRLVELARFAKHLALPLTLHPKYFPTPVVSASRLIVAVQAEDGSAAAMQLTGTLLAACWAQEANINEEATQASALAQCGLPATRIAQAAGDLVGEQYSANTQAAIALGVFGAPTYVVEGEMFWGQDRLDFVARKLRALVA